MYIYYNVYIYIILYYTISHFIVISPAHRGVIEYLQGGRFTSPLPPSALRPPHPTPRRLKILRATIRILSILRLTAQRFCSPPSKKGAPVVVGSPPGTDFNENPGTSSVP